MGSIGQELLKRLSKDFEIICIDLTIMVFLSKIYLLLFSYFMKIKIVDAFGISLILSTPPSLIVVAGTRRYALFVIISP